MFSSGVWYLDLLSTVFLLLSVGGMIPAGLFLCYAGRDGEKDDKIIKLLAKYWAWTCIVGVFATSIWCKQGWMINLLGDRRFWLPIGLLFLGTMSGAWGYGDELHDRPRRPRS